MSAEAERDNVLLWRSMDSFSATFSSLTTGRKRVFADKFLSSMPNMGSHGNLLLTKSQRGTIFPIEHIFPQWPEVASVLSGSHQLLFRLLWLSWIRHQTPYHFSYTKQTPNLNQPSVSRQKNLEDFLLCEFILSPRSLSVRGHWQTWSCSSGSFCTLCNQTVKLNVKEHLAASSHCGLLWFNSEMSWGGADDGLQLTGLTVADIKGYDTLCLINI